MKDLKGKATHQYSDTNKALQKRYNNTLSFVDKCLDNNLNILDLGIDNPLSELLRKSGHKVSNTNINQDLDLDFKQVLDDSYDCVTAFEIFEHMVAPFNLLREIKAPKLIASIPLDLWFAKAYWNEHDEWDRHYHEFEPRQFDMLLEKSGWNIKASEKWVSPSNKIGFRSLLRAITPRYYIVYCER